MATSARTRRAHRGGDAVFGTRRILRTSEREPSKRGAGRVLVTAGLGLLLLLGAACSPTNVSGYPFIGTVHIGDGNGDFKFQVTKTTNPTALHFATSVWDNINDGDCMHATIDYNGISDFDHKVCNDGTGPVEIFDWTFQPPTGLPISVTISICREKNFPLPNNCVQQDYTFH
jgi:hypothetical protein